MILIVVDCFGVGLNMFEVVECLDLNFFLVGEVKFFFEDCDFVEVRCLSCYLDWRLCSFGIKGLCGSMFFVFEGRGFEILFDIFGLVFDGEYFLNKE